MGFSVSGFKMHFFEFLYGLIAFYSRYRLSFAAYLPVLALISSSLHKMPQTLDLPFTLDLYIRGGFPHLLRGVIIF